MSSRFSNAGNSRASAFSGGLSPQPAGKRTAGDPFVNPFISTHVLILWNALIGEFGRTADYWPGNDPAQAVTITLIWKEGAEDETVSPGRYSHVLVQNSDLPSNPKLGDAIALHATALQRARCGTVILGPSFSCLDARHGHPD